MLAGCQDTTFWEPLALLYRDKNSAKIAGGQDSAPYPTEEAYDASPDNIICQKACNVHFFRPICFADLLPNQINQLNHYYFIMLSARSSSDDEHRSIPSQCSTLVRTLL